MFLCLPLKNLPKYTGADKKALRGFAFGFPDVFVSVLGVVVGFPLAFVGVPRGKLTKQTVLVDLRAQLLTQNFGIWPCI